MSISSILPDSDAASYILTDVSNFDNFFEITFDVSNINNLNVNNVYYGFSQNNNLFDNINFSQSNLLAGKSGGTTNFYLDQSLKLDVHRHILWEANNSVIVDTVPKNYSFFTNIDSNNDNIEQQIQSLFDELVLQGSKLSNEISGNPYEYYYNTEKRLFEITLQQQNRLDILNSDISLAQQNNPSASQLSVNLKLLPGDH